MCETVRGQLAGIQFLFSPHGSQGTNSVLDSGHFYRLAHLACPVEHILCQSNAESNEETEMRPLFV